MAHVHQPPASPPILLLALATAVACGGESRRPDAEGGRGLFSEFDAAQITARRELDGEFAERVDPFTGELFVTHTDMVIPGPAGLDIQVTRTLRSRDRYEPQHAMGPLGMRWHLHFGKIQSHDFCAVDAPKVMFLPDGTRQDFAPSVQFPGSYLSRDRWRAECVDGMPVVHSRDGRRYELGYTVEHGSSRWAHVTEISDPDGNWLRFSYAQGRGSISDDPEVELSSNHFVRPLAIEASDGRHVDFDYVEQPGVRIGTLRPPQLVATRSSDPVTGQERVWRYHYDWKSPDTLSEFTVAVVPWLEEVERPDGHSWRFQPCESVHYDGVDGYDQLECQRSLTIETPEGGSTRYDYLSRWQNGEWDDLGKVAAKTRPGSAGAPLGHWSYHYAHDDEGLVTTIEGPVNTVQYVHYGTHNTQYGDNWLVGALAEKRIYDGGLLERTRYEWDKQLISDHDYTVVLEPGGASRTDDNTYGAVLTRKEIERDGETSITEYSQYDALGNAGRRRDWAASRPQDVREISSTYVQLPDRWLVGKVDDSVMAGVGAIQRQHDERGHLVQEDRYGAVTLHTYHQSGEPHRTTGPGGHVTRYEDYMRGLPQTVVHPDGTAEHYTVNGTGTIARHTDANGHATTAQYDGLNRPVAVGLPQGAAVSIAYPDPEVRRLVRGGYAETVTTDEHGRAIRRERSDAEQTLVVDYAYDAAGRKVFESYPYEVGDPQGPSTGTHWSHDGLGRVRSVEHPDGASRHYDYGPNLVSVTDENGEVTVQHHRSYGDPDDAWLMTTTSPEGIVTAVERDHSGAVLWIAQYGSGDDRPELRRQFEYDGARRMSRRFDPEIGWTDFDYDAGGNLVSRRTEGTGATTHQYDARGRRTWTHYPNGEWTQRTYDPVGNPRVVDNGYARRTWDYDAADQVVTERVRVGGSTLHASYGRDALGRVAHVVYPSGRIVTYDPDPLGRPTRALPIANDIQYDAQGNPQRIQFIGGVETQYDSNVRGWTSRIHTHGLAGTIVDLRYESYDGLGNPLAIVDPVAPDRNMTASYDGMSRLTQAHGFWGSANYAYDGRGHLTSRQRGGVTRGFPVAGGLRLADTSYDVRGNIVGFDDLTLDFNPANRLRHVQTSDGAEVSYTYDGDGRLVSQDNDGERTYYMYDANDRWLGQYDATGVPVREWVMLGDTKVGVLSPAVDAALHTNAQGSVLAATTVPDGILMGTEGYHPFGERQGLIDVQSIGIAGGSAWFSGQLEDPTTGLMYFGARWYSPQLSRFLSIDPVDVSERQPHSFNRYAYANNNPMRFIDPDGRVATTTRAALNEWADTEALLERRTFARRHSEEILEAELAIVGLMSGTGLVNLGRSIISYALRKATTKTVYRGVKAGVKQTRSDGFSPRGRHDDVYNHAKGKPGDFVSTSKDPGVAQSFAGKSGYVYRVQVPRGKTIDTNRQLGRRSPFPNEKEVLHRGHLSGSRVTGVRKTGSQGQWSSAWHGL